MDESHIVEAVDPEAAFAVLADASRIEILRALWKAEGQRATFSELRAAVGMDDSGKFNYHLGKLTDRFVRKTEEGYELRTAGRHVVGSLLSRAYTMEGAIEPIGLEDPCPLCGEDLTFNYQDERVHIDCGGCAFEAAFPVPPGTFAGASIDEFPELADRYVTTLLSQARNGFCSACEGRVRPTLSEKDRTETSPEDENLAMVTYDCGRCGSSTQIDLATVLLDHPTVVSFHHDHGIDVRTIRLWQLGSRTGVPQSAVPEDDAVGARLTYTIDGDRLTLALADDLSVISADRSGSGLEEN